MAVILQHEQQLPAAAEHLRRAGPIYACTLGPQHPTTRSAQQQLAPGEPISRDFLLATLALDEEDRAGQCQAVRVLNRLRARDLLEGEQFFITTYPHSVTSQRRC